MAGNNPLNTLMDLLSMGGLITNATNTAMGDLYCIAIFTLVDVALPYISPILTNMGLLTGVGGLAFTNFVQIMKLTMYTQYCANFKML